MSREEEEEEEERGRLTARLCLVPGILLQGLWEALRRLFEAMWFGKD